MALAVLGLAPEWLSSSPVGRPGEPETDGSSVTIGRVGTPRGRVNRGTRNIANSVAVVAGAAGLGDLGKACRGRDPS